MSDLDTVLTPQVHTPLEASLKDILEDVRAEKSADPQHTQSQKPRLTSGIMGYDVSEFELAALERDLAAETARQSASYVLEILSAILSSERSPVLLSKVLDIYAASSSRCFKADTGHWRNKSSVFSAMPRPCARI